jgi:gliding motility-associated-like protein
LIGTATLEEYQELLRTVAYEFTEPEGGRKKPNKKLLVEKSIEFRVYDSDFTNPVAASKDLNLVFNVPPAIQNVSETTQVGSQVTIDLNQLISDPDNNIDLSSLRIVQQPTSGAFAQIDENHNLIIDYSGVNFTGQDQLTVEVCDDLGDCAQNLITIQVGDSGEIEVYNAVAPNSSGKNQYMRIFNLPEGNKVSIYSRWGDKVFEVENYDNDTGGRRFEGSNDNGKPLPSGTYFYRIQIPAGSNPSGPEIITGYISLKQ